MRWLATLQLAYIALQSVPAGAIDARDATAFALTYGYPLLVFEGHVQDFNTTGANQFKHVEVTCTPLLCPDTIRPDIDTLYSQMVWDLSSNDIAIGLPRGIPQDQFVLFSFFDPYGDNFANFGSEHISTPGARFWNFAREDGTLREMFLSYAAAKEAAVKKLPYSKPYLVHKGRTIQLVAKDLQREGKELRIAAVATMCLLAKSAFIEEEYEAGEAHVRAITAVVESRLNEFPGFVWLFVVWADLRLTRVSSRAPVMPYGLHPDFAEAQLPLDLREKASFLGGCNMIGLPSFSVTAAEKITLLLQKVHELALAYNAPKETNWTPVWVVTYDAAYMLAEMKHEIYSIEEVENGEPYSIDKVVLLAAGIQMWSTLSQFIPVPGFLRYGVEQLTGCLSNLEPQTVVDHWIARSGKLDSLLWIFFNASAAAIRLCFVGKLSPSSMPRWLWLGLRYITSTMSISRLSSFVETLRPFPFANDWNERTSKIVWLWMKTGFVMPDDLESEKRRRRSYFANLRLTFDAEVVERVRKEEENRMVTAAHEMLLAGE